MGRTFNRVLVANRGEIARRIFRTLREMGLETVAVFSDADEDAPHVHEADEAVRLGPAPSRESYLDQVAVLEAAQMTDADAIHPGYGFLAENADFAQRCLDSRLVFIGPSPDAIRKMGDKAAAKALAREAGVPVLDGFSVADLDAAGIAGCAEEIGFPLLVKAAASGGGKGMRVVRTADDLDDALAAATREAEAAFGDGALLIERYLEAPRHVEIQVLGDAHGHVVHLFERDCSVQRRHQKVFEESPSPAVDAELRERMGAAAVDLARAVDYEGAGTVEFLLDQGGAFYFLEMNTRLQVEHPVTEAVTGLDLVRLQVEVAQGLPLELGQDDLVLSGHAIEARLYAEDAQRDFLPVTGSVTLWAPPENLPGVRVDSGVEEGSEVTVHYDPMLAKVIAHGRDRAEAVRRLHRGLSELAVGGLVTNRGFLLAVLENNAFRQGDDVATDFLDRHPVRARSVDGAILEDHAVAATLFLYDQRRRWPSPVPPGIPPGWRNNRWRPQEQVFSHGEKEIAVRYVAEGDDRFILHDADGERMAQIFDAARDRIVLEIDGLRCRFRVGRYGRTVTVHGRGRVSELVAVPRFPEAAGASVAGGCAAPMTGKVVEVRVAEGDTVAAGDTLVVLEAMKMEHQLVAHAGGVVESVRTEAGRMVDPDEVLVVVVRPVNENG